jgi:protein-disulfide isomerase
MSDKRYEAPLRGDEQLATDLGINATPSAFVNGRRANIHSVEDLRAALRAAIPETEDAPACGSKTAKPGICLK